MLKRKITKTLMDWKNEENKQCLLVRGARQVGKTFIIEQFCKENYESYIYINFDLSPTLKDIFNGDLDAHTLIMKLEVTFPDIEIKPDEDNLDGMNFVAGKTVDYVCKKAMEGTIEAHVNGGVPNIIIDMEKLDAATIGNLIYFFELACAVSGKILGVNPFNQPGVEEYKKNMFRLLGKPGY